MMLNVRRRLRWRGPSLGFLVLALLLGGLVVAQFVTLLMTVVFPPPMPPQHQLSAVAAALRGVTTESGRPDRLERQIQRGPPDIAGPGWFAPEQSRRYLAGLLRVDVRDVRLAFYTPPPFAGTTPRPPYDVTALANRPWEEAGYTLLLQPPPRGGGMGGGMPGGSSVPSGGFPGSGFPDRGGAPAGPTARPGGGPGRSISRLDGETARPPMRDGDPAAQSGNAELGQRAKTTARPAFGQTPQAGGPTTAPRAAKLAQPGAGDGGRATPLGNLTSIPDDSLRRSMPSPMRTTVPAFVAETAAVPVDPPRVAVRAPILVPVPAPVVLAPAMVAAPPDTDRTSTAASAVRREHQAIPVTPPEKGFFGLVPTGFVEGSFVAALRLGDGRWSIVQPAPEPFPNYWQRRVLLWFLTGFAIVAPLGWLFARRIVKPLVRFADAAERLGRDPSSLVLDLDGPAEVGRAAHAFNLMQSRLKSFVDDRTAMVGAISHDLRTPLTRLRFRIEDVDDDGIRDGMIDEVEEMEAMITSVLAFIRDASTPGARQRVDLRLLLEDVVEDARMVGIEVTLETLADAVVEVDPLGMRRVLGNLLDNAAKYGAHARVRLTVGGGEAFAEVIDDGPGMPADELERAFEPFYRSVVARTSDKGGSGLGLAVCRSIARAHGGDVRLLHAPDGFTAQLRVPLVFDTIRGLAA